MTAPPAAKGADYFSLFGLKPAFSLDMEQLEASFYRQQRQHHPDSHAAAASGVAADLNQAYRELRSPSGRARCLLGLMGRQVSPDDPARLKPELLMRQLELRDQLEQAEDAAQLDQLRRRAQDLLLEVGAGFERAWQQGQAAEAEVEYQQILFTERFVRAIDEREDALLDAGQL